MTARTKRLRGTEMESAMVPFLLRVDDEDGLGDGVVADDEDKGDVGIEAETGGRDGINDEKVVGNIEELKDVDEVGDKDGSGEGSEADIGDVGSAAGTRVDETAAVQPPHYHCFSTGLIVVEMS
ncbi:MAG: hypothetical protein Q9157_006268 [Trypethelium eluteriae]